MEAARNLHAFHEFPENMTLAVAEKPLLWAGTDGRARYRLRSSGRLVFRKADAGPRIASGAGDPADFRNVRVGRGRRESLWRVRHHERRAHRSEGVFLLTGIACGEGDGMRWLRDYCDGRRNGDREGESAGDDYAPGCDRRSRHSQDSTNTESNLQAFSEFTGKVSAAHTKKLGHVAAPQLCVGYLITGSS